MQGGKIYPGCNANQLQIITDGYKLSVRLVMKYESSPYVKHKCCI